MKNTDTVQTDSNRSQGEMPIKEMLNRAIHLHREGNPQEAVRIYDQCLSTGSQDANLLYLRGSAALDLRKPQEAVTFLSAAVAKQPGVVTFQEALAAALLASGNLNAAAPRYEEALRLEPENVSLLFQLGCVLVDQGKNEEAVEKLILALNLLNQSRDPINQRLRALEPNPIRIGAYKKLAQINAKLDKRVFEQHFLRLHKHHDPREKAPNDSSSVDMLFLDAKMALETARKQNRIQQTIYITALQVCYYLGEPIADAPENLICLPRKKLAEFLTTTRIRRPRAVYFDPARPDQEAIAWKVAEILEYIYLLNQKTGNNYLLRNRDLEPVLKSGEPLRFFLGASRRTVVMQYCSRNLAKALERQGCQVKFLIEENDLEEVGFHTVMQEYHAFNPHAVVNINHLNNLWLHPDVYNITWWQDFMPTLTDPKPMPWRERDIALAADPNLIPYLEKTGAKDVQRQEFCVDTHLFRSRTPWRERRKVVFIGGSYLHRLSRSAGEIAVIRGVNERMEAGERVTREFLQEMVDRSGLSLQQGFELGPALTFVVRQTAVEWSCLLAPEMGLEVEVYGRLWEQNPIVKPYFKGELPHGEAVAEVYDQAKYAIAATPYVIDSQRLSEISACGAVPLIYDSRHLAQKPHWDEECLWFHSRETFKACLNKRPVKDPGIIARTHSYDAFARRILEWVRR